MNEKQWTLKMLDKMPEGRRLMMPCGGKGDWNKSELKDEVMNETEVGKFIIKMYSRVKDLALEKEASRQARVDALKNIPFIVDALMWYGYAHNRLATPKKDKKTGKFQVFKKGYSEKMYAKAQKAWDLARELEKGDYNE